MSSTRVGKFSRGSVAIGLLVGTMLLSACDQMDSFTGSRTMRWVGDDLLPKDDVTVKQYRTLPALPDLTAPDAASVFGQDVPKGATDGEVVGKGWSVTVSQSDFATSVRYSDTCGTLLTDAEEVSEQGREVLDGLGLDPEGWAWFVVTDDLGRARAIAEPRLEGRQTWSTGSMAVLVDEDGVCAANGILMGFEPTGESDTLPAAYEVFQDARHTEGLDIAGDYDEHEQTWTLGSDGILEPAWRFKSDKHSIIAVDLGDGLETTLDTESSLRQAVENGATPTN